MIMIKLRIRKNAPTYLTSFMLIMWPNKKSWLQNQAQALCCWFVVWFRLEYVTTITGLLFCVQNVNVNHRDLCSTPAQTALQQAIVNPDFLKQKRRESALKSRVLWLRCSDGKMFIFVILLLPGTNVNSYNCQWHSFVIWMCTMWNFWKDWLISYW